MGRGGPVASLRDLKPLMGNTQTIIHHLTGNFRMPFNAIMSFPRPLGTVASLPSHMDGIKALLSLYTNTVDRFIPSYNNVAQSTALNVSPQVLFSTG